MTTYTVSSGVTSSGLLISAGSVEYVLSGGTATNTTAYGEVLVSSGGVANSTIVESGGVLIGNLTASGTVVENHGLEQLGGTAVDIDTIVSSGGVQWLNTSALASNTTLSGGTQILGGVTSSIPFGVQSATGGTAIGNVVDAGGKEFVGTGATASGTVLNSGGQQQVGGSTTWDYYYGVSSGTTVVMSTNLSGGLASDTTVNSGGDQIVSSGGTAIGTTLYGEEQVVLGGIASATTIEAGGALLAGSSTVSGTVVLSRGLEQLGVATVDSGTTVSVGGTQWLYQGASATDAILNGGIQVIGGLTSSTAFGVQSTTGGTATGTVVNSGGAEYVGTAATATDTVVTSGGTQQVGGSTEWSYYYQVSAGVSGSTMSTNLSGGIVSGTVLSAGAAHGSGAETTQIVGSGGTAIDTALESFAVQRVSAGGVASGTTIDFGNVQAVASGGSSISAVVNSGGLEQGGGTFTSTTVNSGGVEAIDSGGTAVNVTLSGGTQIAGGIQSSTLFGQGSVAPETASGTIVSAGGIQYVGSGGNVTATTVGSGGTEQVGGTTTFAYDYTPGATISVNLDGGVASGTTVDGGGTEIVSSGGAAAGVTLSGGTLDILSGGSATGGITFAGTGGALDVAAPSLGATISGFATGDTIDLENVAFTGATSATITGGVATITEGATTYTLNFASADDGDTLYTVSDGTNGTDVVLCFYPGTRLSTPSGETAVEALRPGDLVRTMNGDLPVRWIGESHVSTRFADPLRTLPIRIKAGALADGIPVRDLLVSPDHAILLDGILVQANALVNGVSIVRERNVPECFTYYHVELATHELLLAEGTPAESFVDNVHRMAFHNWDEHEALHQDASPIAEMSYPRALSHRQVPIDMRSHLTVRARCLFERVGQQAA
jgi:autotransporter passenger strand-loop-strand repeat protein